MVVSGSVVEVMVVAFVKEVWVKVKERCEIWQRWLGRRFRGGCEVRKHTGAAVVRGGNVWRKTRVTVEVVVLWQQL